MENTMEDDMQSGMIGFIGLTLFLSPPGFTCFFLVYVLVFVGYTPQKVGHPGSR